MTDWVDYWEDYDDGGASSGTSSSSSDWRPFVVRRTTGGDVLRPGSGGWRGALRYGARTVLPDEVVGTSLVVEPRYYDSMVVTVQIPNIIPWEQAVLVRGGFGSPTSPQDGVTIWYLATRPIDGSNVSQQVLDTPLTGGNWYYYSLFLWVSGQWVLALSQDNAVPADHGWSEFIFNTVPRFYQRTDDMTAADGRNGPLRVFSRVLGYELDYNNTLADGVRDVFNVDRAPARLLKYLGNNLGVPDEPVLGEARQRSMLQQLFNLNALRGTTLGLKQLVEAATHYDCDITGSGNLLLAVDDGDFNGGDVSQPGMPALLATDLKWGIGHWAVTTNQAILAKLEDPNNLGQFASAHTVTTATVAKNTNPAAALVPPGGTGSMVVNGAGPDTVMVCAPVLTTTSALYGIPTVPGSLYEFSAYVMRTVTGGPPVARVIPAILWFDAKGTFVGTSTYSPPPAAPPLPLNDSGAWQKISLATTAPMASAGGYDGRFAIPAIWWIGTTWAGANTPPGRPTAGRYVSMARFSRVASAGGGLAPIGADLYLTLGVVEKKLSSTASHLGAPGKAT